MLFFKGLLLALVLGLLHAAPSSEYRLKKGWNTLIVPDDGIDIVTTFTQADINDLFYYDAERNLLTLYRADAIGMSVPGHLRLEALEPGDEFSVYAQRDAIITIVPSAITGICLSYADDPGYMYIAASGKKESSRESGTSMELTSRYLPYQKKGFYRDSRVTLIYPKLSTAGVATLRYGPANPRILINYAKAYENRTFYLYDHFQKRCFTGIFPSQKVPPFSDLRALD